MKKYFLCSLIQNGVLGGGLIVDESLIIYRTNKITVDPKYRNLCLSKNDIKSISWNGPVVTITTEKEDSYRFLIFNKKGFIRSIQQKQDS